MQPLWAPWRAEFILEKKTKGCIFCLLPKKKNDRENLIVYRGKKAFIILNKYPYNNGHLMIVPNLHTANLGKLDAKTQAEMFRLTDFSIEVLREAMGAQGHNVGMNLGLAAGAGILDHLHIHVVPRWMGDTNFMPVLASNKVMIEYLHQTYDRLFLFFHKNRRQEPGDRRQKKKEKSLSF